MTELNFKVAKKYINVRHGFMKTKLVMSLFMMIMMICLALSTIDLLPGVKNIDDEQAIPLLIIALVFIISNLYVFISRIVWCVKYGKENVELNEFIQKDEKSSAYLSKITGGKVAKRMQSSSYLIECAALCIVFYIYYLCLIVVGLVGFGLAVTGNAPQSSGGNKYKYAFEISPNKFIYVGQDDKFYNDREMHVRYHLIRDEVYDDDTMKKVGDICNNMLNVDNDVLSKMQ